MKKLLAAIGAILLGSAPALADAFSDQYTAMVNRIPVLTQPYRSSDRLSVVRNGIPYKVSLPTIEGGAAALNAYPATLYGGTWDGDPAHDVSVGINAAYAACAAAGGGVVILPAGTYYVATALSNGASFCKMWGAGIGISRDTIDPSKFIAATRLVWNGANNATMMALAPSGAQSLFDVGIVGVVFDCNAVCNVALKATQFSFSTFQVGVAEALQIGAWFTTNTGGDAPGNQFNKMWVYARHTATSNNKTVGSVSNSCPTGILLDGANGSSWNTSLNPEINVLSAWYNCGDGVVIGNADENEFGMIQTFPEPGVLSGRPTVFANAQYTQANGLTTHATQGAYQNRVRHADTQIYELGFNTFAVVTQGVHTGTGVYNPITIPTTGTTAQLNHTLNFASTTGILAGQIVDCGAGSNMYRDTVITSVTGTTLVMADEAYGVVPSGASCIAKVGITDSAVSGTYTITSTGVGGPFSITAPAGGNSQAGIAAASGAITFTDMVFPITGSAANNDTWTVAVPAPSTHTSVEWVDRNNSVALPSLQPGSKPTLVGTSDGHVGYGGNPTLTSLNQHTFWGVTDFKATLNLAGEPRLTNGNQLQWLDSGGTPKNIAELFSDNKFYLNGGVAGLVLRDNYGASTIGASDGSANWSFSHNVSLGTRLLFSAMVPTIASGGCTTGSVQSVSQANGSAAFAITLGGATCGSTIVLTMPAANAGWVCDAHDITTPAGNVLDQTAGGSTTSVTLTNYARTTGLAANFTGGDVLAVKCLPY